METQRPRQSHKDLILWQKALDLAVAVHEVSSTFPRSEVFGLVSQLRRAIAAGTTCGLYEQRKPHRPAGKARRGRPDHECR